MAPCLDESKQRSVVATALRFGGTGVRAVAKFRVGAEGRISHLKRSYGLDRSRLNGQAGARAWAAWAILAYNLDTLAHRTVRAG